MNAQELLQQIADYCRQSGLAESTFGRRAVNDGKLTSRLRNGGRITTETLDRIRSFMSANAGIRRRSGRQFPLLRQPPEISPVREHLQREMGGGEPRRTRTRQYPSAPAGGA